VLRKCPLQALVESRRIEKRVEKDRAVALGQDEGLALCDRPARGLRQRRRAEVSQLSPLEMSRALDQRASASPDLLLNRDRHSSGLDRLSPHHLRRLFPSGIELKANPTCIGRNAELDAALGSKPALRSAIPS
jgi:hypothetical protein